MIKIISLAISGITPFLDFTGLSIFIEKISIYLLIGTIFYFSRIIKKDIDIKYNSDSSVRDMIFNKILANRDAKFNAELTSHQASNYSAGQASNHSSASLGQLTFTGISLTIWNQFKQIFNWIMTKNNYTLEEMCLSVAIDICLLEENIKKAMVQEFYERNIKKKNDYISTLDQIGL
ncbi:8687_t:CDS:2 [Ambispora leptoticha]|uniref:8687_t:CDS:1 n=1 Tax=Ambispora leptoticha TaxID=144679 RepID=A0A9N8Z5P9_9GLOM|nr:8687_t:CDS:2 [Ambispora leptoticha]